jgi:hypothetical protein
MSVPFARIQHSLVRLLADDSVWRLSAPPLNLPAAVHSSPWANYHQSQRLVTVETPLPSSKKSRRARGARFSRTEPLTVVVSSRNEPERNTGGKEDENQTKTVLEPDDEGDILQDESSFSFSCTPAQSLLHPCLPLTLHPVPYQRFPSFYASYCLRRNHCGDRPPANCIRLWCSTPADMDRESSKIFTHSLST